GILACRPILSWQAGAPALQFRRSNRATRLFKIRWTKSGVTNDRNLLRRARGLRRNQQRSAHTFENAAEIAIGGNDCGGVVLEGRACYVETAQEKVKVLRVGRAVDVGINARCFRVGFAFDLQGVTVGTGNNR